MHQFRKEMYKAEGVAVRAVNRIWVLKSGGQFPAGARDF
jgi:hypothetical protein